MVLSFASAAASAAAPDCALGERYVELATKASAEFRQADAYQFMERAVEACPSYETWMRLGELASELGEDAHNARAAEAFVAAYEAARTSPEQAVAVGRYAELLLDTNDPQKALTYVQQARNLDPANPWIAELATTINDRASRVTEEDIKRGLGDLAFKPLRLQRVPDPAAMTSTSGGASVAPTPAQMAASRSEVVESKRAVNIPLNFEVNSTQLDQWTRQNIAVLAKTLAEPDYAANTFMLVGHADVRGEPGANMALSVERAKAIAKEIVAIAPSLDGRLRTAGRGEESPLSLGDSEEDHRVNRRLEVVLQ
jgi:outer membrane protein OmpA-like peptidoglycan-associated protein